MPVLDKVAASLTWLEGGGKVVLTSQDDEKGDREDVAAVRARGGRQQTRRRVRFFPVLQVVPEFVC